MPELRFRFLSLSYHSLPVYASAGSVSQKGGRRCHLLLKDGTFFRLLCLTNPAQRSIILRHLDILRLMELQTRELNYNLQLYSAGC
jgi:hypothetical protein